MTTFVDMYHPALGNVHVLADSSAVSLYEAHGWVKSGGGSPTPDPINLTPALGDLRYVQLGDRTTFVPFWTAAEAVTTGAVRVDSTGHLITANSNRTTRGSYDATEQAAWTVVGGASGALLAASNLSDLASASTARTNLGLGSAATQPSSAFDAAGAATTAAASRTLLLTPTATKTASYTATVGDLAMMNVAGGGTVINLPTAPADKSQVAFRAIGATATTPLVINRGGSTDTIGTAGAITASLPTADETTVLQYDAPNTRWLAVATVRTKKSLDLAYAQSYNAQQPQLYNWHNAIARARAGGNSARIDCIGDSTTKGSNLASAPTIAYPSRLRTILGGLVPGVTTVDGGLLLNDNTNDPRYTQVTSWAFQTSAGYIKALSGFTNSTATAILSVTGQDTLRVWWARGSGLGTSVVTVNDGTDHAQTINTAGASGISFTEWTGLTAGTQTVTFAIPTVGTVNFLAIETFSTTGKLLILNKGMGGATTANLIAGGATGAGAENTLLTVGAQKADLIILDMMINDWINQTNPATAQSNMQTFITAAKASNQDCLLIVPVPPNESTGSATYTWAQYVAVVYALADANNLPVVDITARWVDHATATTKGIKADTWHPNATGYADKAQAIANVVGPS